MTFLGAAALAVYSRPRSLVLQVRTLVFKMAAVLTPSVSSLQALGSESSIGDLVIKATRYGMFLTLPLTLTFIIFGGPLMQLWMGPRYDNGWLIAILAAGYASFIIQSPTLSILAGMNLHGSPGLVNFAGSVCTALAVALVIGPLKLGLPWVAVAATFPLSIAYAVYVPLYTCRRLNIPIRRYLRKAIVNPIFSLAPFAVCLLAVRLFWPGKALSALIVAGVGGGALLGWIYWRNVLPNSLKLSVVAFCKGRGPASPKPSGVAVL
jgi:O-antigen/teichoic acid export membrane protein